MTFSLFFELLDELVKRHESEGKWGEARELIQRVKKSVRQRMRGERRAQYLDELERRHFLRFWNQDIPSDVKILVHRTEE